MAITKEQFEAQAAELFKKKPVTEEKKVEEPVKEPEKEIEAEMDIDKRLDKARAEFIQADLKLKKLDLAKKKDEEKIREVNILAGEKETMYWAALKTKREQMLEKAKGDRLVKTEEPSKEELQNIIRETVTREALRLAETKVDLGAKVFTKRITKAVVEGTKFYRKLPPWLKISMGGTLFGVGVAGGILGGTVGAALVGGVAGGRWIMRALSAPGAYIFVESLVKRAQEKKAEEKTIEEFAKMPDGLLKIIQEDSDRLNEKLFKLEGTKKRQRYWRNSLAFSLSVLTFGGWTGKALVNYAHWAGIDKLIMGWMTGEGEKAVPGAGQKPILSSTPGGPPYPEARPGSGVIKSGAPYPEARPAPAGVGFVEVAQKGDSIWKMAEREAAKYYGEKKWDTLGAPERVHLTDAIKDKIAANPRAFGLTDIDKIQVGQKIDFSQIFQNKSDMDGFFKQAVELTTQDKISIIKDGLKIQDWVEHHPGQALNTERVNEILSGHEAGTSSGAGSEAVHRTAEQVIEESMGKPSAAVPSEVVPGQAAPAPESLVGQAIPPEKMLSLGENYLAKIMGFNPDEYKIIGQVTVGKLLEEIPSREKAWEIWRSTGGVWKIDLPHHGYYGNSEFGHHINLAEYIRAFNPSEGLKKMTVSSFLRRVAESQIRNGALKIFK